MSELQTPGTSIAVRSSNDLATPGDVLNELERTLVSNERVDWPEEDAEQIAAEIVAQILAAETDEQLAAMMGGNATGWKELLGVPIELFGFKWRPSDYEQGSVLYFVVFGTRLDTGEPVVLTTGSRNALAQLVNKAKRGVLTGSVVALVEAEKETRRGFKPMWLVSVQAPALESPADSKKS